MEESKLIQAILIGKGSDVIPTELHTQRLSLPPFFLTKDNKLNPVGDIEKISINQASVKANSISDRITTALQGGAITYPQFFEVRLKSMTDSDWWTLPIEPLLSVKSKKVLIKRRVAKPLNMRGTVKETWSNDDYEINIQGKFISTVDGMYPRNEMMKLRSLLEANERLNILCPLLEIFNIHTIVVEDWDFPFTKGKENQTFMIKAVSDDPIELLIKK